MSTTKELLKARAQGAQIRACRVNGDVVQYMPGRPGNRKPRRSKDGLSLKRYTAVECIAIDRVTGRPWSGRAPAA